MPGFRTANGSVRTRGSVRWRRSSETTPGAVGDTVAIGPERYNDLYEKFGNLNSLLGWGHARVIENLLAKKPDCPRALSDKFADARVIERALLAARAERFSSNSERRPNPTSPSRRPRSWLGRLSSTGWSDGEGVGRQAGPRSFGAG